MFHCQNYFWMCKMTVNYGTGRISEVIDFLESTEQQPIFKISPSKKLETLCHCLKLDVSSFDHLITDNSPVFRTVKGHAFETFFDNLMHLNNVSFTEVGGDDSVDRIVNNITLQLKTPTEAGTSGNIVQFKTHKTHGAKSEKESLSYYHDFEGFADILVGLVGYSPLNILFLLKEELPSHPSDPTFIVSPANFQWDTHAALNNYARIGLTQNITIPGFSPADFLLLPLCSAKSSIPSAFIIDTILNKSNFRIWDMSIRGFAREYVFEKFLLKLNLELANPTAVRPLRGDKADHAFLTSEGYKFLQMKGISTNNCNFTLSDPLIAVETQLTRGRVNDHPTQSRLYLKSDFDFLVIGLDPSIVHLCRQQSGLANNFDWEFYIIPTSDLSTHHVYSNRLKSLQKFNYKLLQEFRLTESTFASL